MVLASFIFTPYSVTAQCADISSNLTCALTVDIIVFDTPTCNNVCNSVSQIGVVIAPGAVYNVDCTGCGTVCNIEVTIVAINGTAITPVMADFTNTGAYPGLPFGSTTSGCGTMAQNIYYDAGGATFKISQQ